ncbi:MAG: hypothetical protein HY941_03470 [Gammaproteobacteria bacterium]|nr:hypothetical protein [Gammaproteobacteria bacterium]
MTLTVENTLSALGLLGFGGALGTYLRIVWERMSSAQLQKQEFKDARYKCIIMLMYTLLDFDKRSKGLEKFGRDFKTQEELIDEIKAEWHNAILFASDEVLENLHAFIKDPSAESFKKSALSMRKDLWGGKLSATLESLEF